jgi:hypothetical protein
MMDDTKMNPMQHFQNILKCILCFKRKTNHHQSIEQIDCEWISDVNFNGINYCAKENEGEHIRGLIIGKYF